MDGTGARESEDGIKKEEKVHWQTNALANFSRGAADSSVTRNWQITSSVSLSLPAAANYAMSKIDDGPNFTR